MPLLTIASAICRISVSLMLQPNVFQVFQPIGGVRATPFSSACALGALMPNTTAGSRTPTARTDNQRQIVWCRFIGLSLRGPARSRRC